MFRLRFLAAILNALSLSEGRLAASFCERGQYPSKDLVRARRSSRLNKQIADRMSSFLLGEPAGFDDPEVTSTFSPRPVGRKIKPGRVTTQTRRHVASRALGMVQTLK